MSSVGQPSRDPAETAVKLRHRRVPERVFADKLIVARPSDGAPVVLAPPAALVWQRLEGWTTVGEIDRHVAAAFPEVVEERRMRVRAEVLAKLGDDDLLERG